jgi:hypothetical protein
MLYLSGAVRSEFVGLPGVGFIVTPNMGNRIPDGVPWAADNGCFTDKVPFSLSRYLAWLEARRPVVDRCLFATAPDVVGDAAATWARGGHVLPMIRELGYPAGYCAQNGIDADTLAWDAFDALFVGGDDAFKLAESTYALVAEAKRRGKWTHMGRVNSAQRFRAAALSGYDSVDGTFLAFGPDKNLPRLQRWLDAANQQSPLWEAS